MTRTREQWYVTTLLISGSLIASMVVFLQGDLNGQNAANSGAKKTKSSSVPTREPEIATDLDDAIRLLNESDFKTFFEKYAPVEILRRLRQQDLVERATTVMSSEPQTKRHLLSVLEALRKQTPVFDKSRGIATIQFETLGSGIVEISGELHLPATENLKLTGLGKDLNKVLAEATRLLAAGEVQAVVNGLFPASELARLQEPGAMQDLVQQLSVGPIPSKFAPAQQTGRKAIQDTPPELKAWQADLRQLQSLSPELTDDGRLAIFRIESPGSLSVRIIKFQKTEAGWRLFDDVKRVTTELTRQSKLKPKAGIMTVQMERIGGNWRFIELPALQVDEH